MVVRNIEEPGRVAQFVGYATAEGERMDVRSSYFLANEGCAGPVVEHVTEWEPLAGDGLGEWPRRSERPGS